QLRDTGGHALHLDGVQDLKDVCLACPDRFGLARHHDRHVDLEPLAQADLVEVDVQNSVPAGGKLHFFDQDFVRPAAVDDQIDQLSPAAACKHAFELAVVQLDGGAGSPLPVDNSRQLTFTAEPARRLASNLSFDCVQLHGYGDSPQPPGPGNGSRQTRRRREIKTGSNDSKSMKTPTRVRSLLGFSALVIVGLGLGTLPVVVGNAAASRAATAYHRQYLVLEEDLRSAAGQGYTARDLSPIPTRLKAGDSAQEPWWIPGRSGFYEHETADVSQLSRDLKTLEQKVF